MQSDREATLAGSLINRAEPGEQCDYRIRDPRLDHGLAQG
jgi:hypothetical protein